MGTTMTAAMFASYVRNDVSTASPARLLTMLYDRLVLDLQVAEQALGQRDLSAANDRLVHAQEILLELAASLDVEKWSGAPGLLSLYQYLLAELAQANIAKDVSRVATCRGLIEPLRDAWHEAARVVATEQPTQSR